MRTRTIRRTAPLLAVASVFAALPLAGAVAKKPVNHAKIGYYVGATPVETTINVQKNHKGKLVVKTLQTQCMTDTGPGGTINLKSIAITAAGTFKVDGNIKILSFGDSFKTKLKITGTFKRNKVTGTITPKNDTSPCIAANFAAPFYGNVTGG